MEGVEYKSTIRAMPGASKGECKKIASTKGSHPYIRDACHSLRTGRSNSLLCKLNRAASLKNPRGTLRVGKSGVRNKYLSKSEIKSGLLASRVAKQKAKRTVRTMEQSKKRLLKNSWMKNENVRPFLDKLIYLLSSESLNDFDLSFLNNWLSKKIKGKYYRANEQARSLAILLSNKLGEKMYSTIAPMMGMPSHRQAQRIRAKELSRSIYMPGLNDWAFEIASKDTKRPLQNSMDGTRVVRIIERYNKEYLVGAAFSPDVRLFPSPDKLPNYKQCKAAYCIC